VFLLTKISRILYQAGFREYTKERAAGYTMEYVPGTKNTIIALMWRDDTQDLDEIRIITRLSRIATMLRLRGYPCFHAVGLRAEPFLFINGIPMIKENSRWRIQPLRKSME
jgi:hypothetical protein